MPSSPLPLHSTVRTYTTTDGLVGMRVEDIVEDREGYLWFATNNGINRFDGEIFQRFTRSDGLTGLQVMAMHLDREGQLWLATLDGGLCRFDGQGFRGFEADNGVSDGPIECLFEDRRGRLYFGGLSTLGYWNGQEFRDLRPALYRDCGIDNFANCWGIDQDGQGHIWFAFSHGCLLRFDGTHFRNMAQVNGLLVEGMHSAVGCDEQGEVWACLGQRLWRYNGRRFSEEAKPTEAIVRKFQRDASGRLWMCTSGDGAYTRKEGQWFHWAPPKLLPFPSVKCVREDREGHLWFATWGGGACRCDTRLVHITSASGLPAAQVSSLVADQQHRLWLGFWDFASPPSAFIARFDGEKIEVLGAENGLEIGSCSALYSNTQGALWVGDITHKGLYQYTDKDGFRAILPKAFAGYMLTALAEDRAGNLLLGCEMRTEKGPELQLCRWDGNRLERLCSVPSGFNHYITAIAASESGSFWFGIGTLGGVGKSQGLIRFEPETGISIYSTAEGLPDSRIYDVLEDRQGQLWVATAAGLCRFDGQSFHTFTSDHGLPSEAIQGLYQDRQGQLWVATPAGLGRFNGQTFQRVLSKQVGSTYKVTQDSEGRYWFGTESGLVGYTPNRQPPPVRILRVLADQIYPEAKQVRVSASTRQIAFEFKGMSFRTFVDDMLYQWRLQGHQDQWQSPTSATEVVYTGLVPGNYLFEVRAIDQDGNISATPAQVELEILPDPLLSGLAKSLAQSSGEFVGTSAALRQVQAQFHQVAQTDLSVLILGETGTGKGLSAKTIHQLSARREEPFIPVNCGAIPEGLVESELFGHERGAFTGANQRQLGKVELAAGGTLFLDEIGDMPLAAQTKLLRFLEDFTFERVGGRQSLKADVRVVAATNRALEQMVAAGSFREDLYFRLKIFPVQLPPLRQRVEDIPLLARYFIDRFAHHLNRNVPGLGEGTIMQLQAYGWPGNVRELEHVIQRAVLLCPGDRIEAEEMSALLQGTDKSPQEDGGILTLAEREKRHILQALELTGWVIEGAQGTAQLLDINPSTLRLRMKKHGIVRLQQQE